MDRYEEALAKARVEYEKARKQGYAWLMNLLEGMFPELKESEDEKIRKWLIEEIKATHDYDSPTSRKCVDDALAYLEKQKDLDKMIVVSPEVWDNAINDAYKNGKKNGEKQKEQKFTEKQDYSDLTDLERAIHRGFLVVGVENVPVTIIKETAQDCLAQMKPAEWSEEDEQMRGTCIDLLEHDEVIGPWKDCIAWLKSLRPPQYCENCKLKRSVENWKPSKNQMTMLLAVINDPNNAGAESCHLMLQSLYADLQKLL